MNQSQAIQKRTKGFWFFFDADNKKIAAHSTFGTQYKDSIYVDDELVSQKRSFKGQGIHSFTVDKNDYRIMFKTQSFMRTDLTCALYCNGNLVSEQISAFYEDTSPSKKMLFVGIAFAISFIVSFTFTTFF